MTSKLGYWGERADLLIKQGATFGSHRITLIRTDGSPFPLTGCTPSGQIRRSGSDASVIAEFTFNVVSESGGLLDMSLTDEQTAAIEAAERPDAATSKYVYDVKLTVADGRIIPVAWGNVSVLREVTRAA